MKLQLSIRGALVVTTAIAFYAAILGLAYQGNPWGQGLMISVTLCLSIWIFSAVVYWGLLAFLAIFGIQEKHQTRPLVPLVSSGSVPAVGEVGSDKRQPANPSSASDPRFDESDTPGSVSGQAHSQSAQEDSE